MSTKKRNSKPWYLSKGIISGVIGVAISLLIAIDQGLSLPQILLAGFSAENILIRGVTKLPLGK